MDSIWIYILEVSLGTALVWAVYYGLLRNLTFFSWNRLYLLAGTILALIIPLIDIEFVWGNAVPIQNFILFINPVKEISTESNSFTARSIFQILSYFYFFVAASRLLIFGVGTVMIFRKINNVSIQLIDGIKIYTRPDFKPASFFNKILMPQLDNDKSIHQQILIHELEHVRLGHSWDLLFLHLVKSLLWINPFVYLIERALREVHEYQADKKVIQKSGVQVYCRLLMDNLTTQTPNPLFHSFNQFQIKNRIIMMNKQKSKNVERWKYLIGMPTLIMMLAILSWNMAEPKAEVAGVRSDVELKSSVVQVLNDKVVGNTNDQEFNEVASLKTSPLDKYLVTFPRKGTTEGGC